MQGLFRCICRSEPNSGRIAVWDLRLGEKRRGVSSGGALITGALYLNSFVHYIVCYVLRFFSAIPSPQVLGWLCSCRPGGAAVLASFLLGQMALSRSWHSPLLPLSDLCIFKNKTKHSALKKAGVVGALILAVHNHSALRLIFLQNQFRPLLTFCALANDKVRPSSIMNFPFYDLKPYFPGRSSVVEESPGNTPALYSAEGVDGWVPVAKVQRQGEPRF